MAVQAERVTLRRQTFSLLPCRQNRGLIGDLVTHRIWLQRVRPGLCWQADTTVFILLHDETRMIIL